MLGDDDQNVGPPEVVILLGAGASRAAGIPLMLDFIPGFRAELPLAERAVLDVMVERLVPVAPERVVDLEILLAALQRSSNLRRDLVAALLQKPEIPDLPSSTLLEIESALKKYIRRRCTENVTPDRVDYLGPLIDFARPTGTLDVFSLNYDMCIEMIAERRGISYTDGFEPLWDPASLEATGTREAPLVRLHKIHGSIVWYRRSRYRYVKMPLVPPSGEELRYFDHEAVGEMMLYPALLKEGNVGPYPYLVHRLREALHKADILVAIGYSFRDEYVRNLVLEALVNNQDLVALLVSPNANDISSQEFVSDGISTRVFTCPEPVEKALEQYRLYHLVNRIVRAEQLRRDAERLKPAHLVQSKGISKRVAWEYLQIGQVDAVREVVEREARENPEGAHDYNYHLLPDLAVCSVFALLQGHDKSVWWALLAPLLYSWEYSLLGNDPSTAPPKPYPDMSQSGLTPNSGEIVAMQESLRAYLLVSGDNADPRIRCFSDRIDMLCQISAVRFSADLEPDARASKSHELILAYIDTPTASQVARQLSECNSIPAPPSLCVNWRSKTLYSHGNAP